MCDSGSAGGRTNSIPAWLACTLLLLAPATLAAVPNSEAPASPQTEFAGPPTPSPPETVFTVDISATTVPLFAPADWLRGPYGPLERLPPVTDRRLGVMESDAFGREDAGLEMIERLPPLDFEQFEAVAIPDANATGELTPPRGPGESAGAMGGPMSGKSPFSMSGFWVPPTEVQKQAASLGMNMEAVNVGFPLRRPQPGSGLWLGLANFSRLELSTGAVLPGANLDVPNQLWSLQIGTLYTRTFESGWTTGGVFQIGSASDQPFAGLRDMTLTTALFANRPARNQRDAWNFSVFYSPTSQLPYPLPGLAYVWRPSDKFEASLGIPASLRYRPNDQFTFSMSYVPLTNFAARAQHQFRSKWSLYCAYQVYTETYFLAERVNTRERFYLFDQRVSIGLERALPYGLAIDLSALYLFDRQIFQGVNFSSDRQDVLRFDPGVGINAQLLWRR